VGIDIEYMSHNIERLSHKFINDDEVITDNPVDRIKHLYVHWCAKEVLYKISNYVDINFKDNLCIKPFEIAKKGCICGFINNNANIEEFDIHYKIENNYAMAYCAKGNL